MYSIAGTGSYCRKNLQPRSQQLVGTSDEWIEAHGEFRSGMAAEGETTPILRRSRRAALDGAGVTADDIGDRVGAHARIWCSQRRHAAAGSIEITAARIQYGGACTGFVYALSVADKFVRLEAKCALVVGAETRPHHRLERSGHLHCSRMAPVPWFSQPSTEPGIIQHAAAFRRQVQDLLSYRMGVEGFKLVPRSKAGVQMKTQESQGGGKPWVVGTETLNANASPS